MSGAPPIATVACALADLSSAEWFERLGFTLSSPSSYQFLGSLPSGRPSLDGPTDSLGLRGRYATFADASYLEFVAPAGDGRPSLTYGDFVAAHGEGWMKVSLGVDSLTPHFLRLCAAGRLNDGAPWTFWRRHFADTRGVPASHTTSLISLSAERELLVALTEQLDRVADPALSAHANGAVGIRGVTVLATGPAALAGLFDGAAAVEVLDRPDGWPIAPPIHRPCVAAPTVAVADLDALARRLREGAVDHTTVAGGLLAWRPDGSLPIRFAE
ncbi:VOC family protein [Phenylobacterium sp.]|uniref:VOC family protein n=1 Tax=Phenylobacterium sp. TaxID=1871053 RepID=UPI00301BE8B1